MTIEIIILAAFSTLFFFLGKCSKQLKAWEEGYEQGWEDATRDRYPHATRDIREVSLRAFENRP